MKKYMPKVTKYNRKKFNDAIDGGYLDCSRAYKNISLKSACRTLKQCRKEDGKQCELVLKPRVPH